MNAQKYPGRIFLLRDSNSFVLAPSLNSWISIIKTYFQIRSISLFLWELLKLVILFLMENNF